MFNPGIITKFGAEFIIEHKNGLCYETTFDFNIVFRNDIYDLFLSEFKFGVNVKL